MTYTMPEEPMEGSRVQDKLGNVWRRCGCGMCHYWMLLQEDDEKINLTWWELLQSRGPMEDVEDFQQGDIIMAEDVFTLPNYSVVKPSDKGYMPLALTVVNDKVSDLVLYSTAKQLMSSRGSAYRIVEIGDREIDLS